MSMPEVILEPIYEFHLKADRREPGRKNPTVTMVSFKDVAAGVKFPSYYVKDENNRCWRMPTSHEMYKGAAKNFGYDTEEGAEQFAEACCKNVDLFPSLCARNERCDREAAERDEKHRQEEEARARVEKWDRRFLGLAEHVASWSKDPSTRVGAVIVDDQRRIVSVGFNGLPQKCKDDPAVLSNRELKLKRIIHAEVNCILTAGRSVVGCTLYTVPFLPCATCASIVIQAGIARCVSLKSDVERWQKDFELTRAAFAEAGVSCVEYPTLSS